MKCQLLFTSIWRSHLLQICLSYNVSNFIHTIIYLTFSWREWNASIREDSIKKAEVITKYYIEQKFALMQPELQVVINVHTGRVVLDENLKYLSKLVTFKNANIKASDVSQFRLMPPKPKQSQSKNKYPVEQWKTFMKEVSPAGFGSAEEVHKGGGRKALTLWKHLYSQLGNAQRETLKQLRINEDLYNVSQSSNSSHSATSDNLSRSSGSDGSVALITLCTPESLQTMPH